MGAVRGPGEILHGLGFRVQGAGRRWFKVGLVSRDGVEGLRGSQ